MADEANVWAPRTTPQVNSESTLVSQLFNANAGQTLFELTNFNYFVGVGALLVYKNGAILRPVVDYIETSISSFTLLSPTSLNDQILPYGFIGITGAVSVPLSDLFAASFTAMRQYVGASTILYVRGNATNGDGGEGYLQLFGGQAPGFYVDDDQDILVPDGGDGSSAWLRQTPATTRNLLDVYAKSVTDGINTRLGTAEANLTTNNALLVTHTTEIADRYTKAETDARIAAGGNFTSVVSIAVGDSPYSVLDGLNGALIQVDTTGGSVVLLYPDINTVTVGGTVPWNVTIDKLLIDSNTITRTGAGADTVEGSASAIMTATRQLDTANFGTINWTTVNLEQIYLIPADIGVTVQAHLGAAAISRINSPLISLSLRSNLNPIGGVGLVTSVRADTATYIDRYGVLQTAAIDEPRFEKDGLLNEVASTNDLTFSEQFDNAAWAKGGSSITANAANAPNGNLTADELVEDATAGAQHRMSRSVSFTISQQYTLSAFIKRGIGSRHVQLGLSAAGSFGRVYFDLDTSAVATEVEGGTGKIQQLANDWFRISITGTANATLSGQIFLAITDATTAGSETYNGDGVSSIYWFGGQSENLPLATSYIPTTTGAISRAADIPLTVTHNNNVPSVFEPFTWLCNFDVLDTSTLTRNGLIRIDGYTTLVLFIGGADFSFTYGSGSVVAVGTIVDGVKYRAGVVFDGTDIILYLNGTEVARKVGQTPDPSGSSTDLRVGKHTSDAADVNRGLHMSNTGLLDIALTAAEMEVA